MKLTACLLTILALSVCVFAQSSKSNKTIAQNFTVNSLEGDSFDLASLKGKVVLITFWSTKCAICVAEIPNLNKLAASYDDKDVVFLGLALQDERELKRFLKKKPFDFQISPKAFGVIMKYADKDSRGRISMGFPSHYIINQQGEIELKTMGFDKTDKLDRTISNLLKSNVERIE